MDANAWMTEAMREASKAGWGAHPNPMVGAVIVKDGKELGRGYHHAAGQPHAEIEALRQAAANGYDVSGADIYVTLEPCNHYGRTPPCTEALIRAKIARCFIGTLDSDVRVRGAGVERLRQAGITCEVGICQKALTQLNAAFFTRTRLKRPYITAKWAMTADGFTATHSGSSQWITGIEARTDVHRERARYDAIIAGTQTVLFDNPTLNVRHVPCSRQPVRVLLDRCGRIPTTHHIFDTTEQKTILFTSKEADLSRYDGLSIEIETVETCDGKLDLRAVMECLAVRHLMTTLYCEGGATLHGALNDLDMIDAVDIYIAPKLIGGVGARACIAGNGVPLMSKAREFVFDAPVRLGNDIKLSGRFDVRD